MKSVSEKDLVDINNKLNRLAETTHEIQSVLNRTSSRIEEIAKTIEKSKDTTNAVYKFVEKQDYNSKNSRHWLPVIACSSLGFLVGYQGYESTWEVIAMLIIIVFLFYGYVHYSKD